MVLRCAWGTCNGDARYPERLGEGGKLITFPKPKRDLAKCLRWIRACGRPHDQLNVDRINKHKAVCSKVKRRELWKKATKRVSLKDHNKLWEPSEHDRICSCHFISGKPSREESDPDYAPSVFVFTPQWAKTSSCRSTAAASKLNENDCKQTLQLHTQSTVRHFVGGWGPTAAYPDPIPADCSRQTPTRPAAKNRKTTDFNLYQSHIHLEQFHNNIANVNTSTSISATEVRPSTTSTYISSTEAGPSTTSTYISVTEVGPSSNSTCISATEVGPSTTSSGAQTEENWVSAMDVMAMSSEIHNVRVNLAEKDREINTLKQTIHAKHVETEQLKQTIHAKDVEIEQLNVKLQSCQFNFEVVVRNEGRLKDLVKFYTGITYVRFMAMVVFLIPDGVQLPMETGRNDIGRLTNEDCLFLTLCKLRHNFGLKDLALRFGISLHSTGVIFNTWVSHMYNKFGQLSIWPHRDKIIELMPTEYKKDFPTSLVMIDSTELRTQVPGAHSQMDCDYKPYTTLKGLIACDPNGVLVFVSQLFPGPISDKEITENSGFYDLLKLLKDEGFIIEGDAIMAGKGFTIKEQIESLGLKLNSPPLASASSQVYDSDSSLTLEMAKHRVQVEQFMARVKGFQILSGAIPTSLFQTINKIWSVCCYLTLYQDPVLHVDVPH